MLKLLNSAAIRPAVCHVVHNRPFPLTANGMQLLNATAFTMIEIISITMIGETVLFDRLPFAYALVLQSYSSIFCSLRLDLRDAVIYETIVQHSAFFRCGT